MKWIVRILVTLIAAVATVLLVGSLLSEAHVASLSVDLDAPPAVVWGTLLDIERFPEWRPDVDRVDRAEDSERIRWVEHGSEGALPFVVERADSARTLVARIDSDELPFGGSWTYDLEPLPGGGTRLTITERGEVYNPVFRFVSKFVMGHTATIERYLDALERRLAP